MSASVNVAGYGAGQAGGAAPMLLLLARIFLGVLFIVPGIRKLLAYGGTVGYFAKLGFPSPEVFVVIAIAIEIVAGIMLIVGWRTRLAAWVFVAFVAIATAMAHRFWEFEAAQFGNQLNHFLKNLAVIGGLLFVATFGPGRSSIDRG